MIFILLKSFEKSIGSTGVYCETPEDGKKCMRR